MGKQQSTAEELPQLLQGGGVTAGLRALLDATEAGEQPGASAWQFALHLPRLREGGLTPTLLRRLIRDGYLEQRIETTGKNARRRTFRVVQHGSLEGRCCFLLTAKGVSLVRLGLKDTPPGELADDTVVNVDVVRPHWSAGSGVLWMGKLLVRRVAKNAKNLRQVLAALEEENWPAEGTDNPLSPTKKVSDVQRLTEVLEELNQHQGPARIEFSLDDSKTRGLWRIP